LKLSTTDPPFKVTAVPFVVVRQCRTVTPGQVLDYGGKGRFESGHAADLKTFASVTWFTDGACTAGALPGPSSNIPGPAPNVWHSLHANDVTVPAGRNSAFFLLSIDLAAGEGVAWLDDVYFGPDPLTPVELMGWTVE